MGEGSDFMDGGGGYEQAPQGGGEYYATGSQVPVPGNWGPAPQPQYAPHPQYQQPPPEYQPQQTQQPYPRQALPQRRRKASKGLQRMYQVQCWEELLNAPIFGDANDPSAQIVQNEVYAFAERRINELLGEAPEKPVHELTSQEVQVLKALAQKMLEPEEEAPAEQQEDEPPAPPAPPQAPPRPPPPARAPVAPPRAQPVQQPAPQAPLPPPPAPRGFESGGASHACSATGSAGESTTASPPSAASERRTGASAACHHGRPTDAAHPSSATYRRSALAAPWRWSTEEC
jgi:outer membrane biosynthesis protein TonB